MIAIVRLLSRKAFLISHGTVRTLISRIPTYLICNQPMVSRRIRSEERCWSLVFRMSPKEKGDIFVRLSYILFRKIIGTG